MGIFFFFFFETVGDVDMEIISGDLVEVSSPTKPSFRTWKRMLCKSTNPSPNTNSCHNITHLSNRQPLKLLKLFLHLLETLITRDKQLRQASNDCLLPFGLVLNPFSSMKILNLNYHGLQTEFALQKLLRFLRTLSLFVRVFFFFQILCQCSFMM